MEVKELQQLYYNACEHIDSSDETYTVWMNFEATLREELEKANAEKRELIRNAIPLESVYMICSGLRYERGSQA